MSSFSERMRRLVEECDAGPSEHRSKCHGDVAWQCADHAQQQADRATFVAMWAITFALISVAGMIVSVIIR